MTFTPQMPPEKLFEDEFPETAQILMDLCQANNRAVLKQVGFVDRIGDVYEDEPIGRRYYKRLFGIPDVNRNEPCVCASGKKFKKCHLPIIQAEQKFNH